MGGLCFGVGCCCFDSSGASGGSTPVVLPWQGGSHGRGRPVAREPASRVPRGAGAEISREGAVRRDEGGGRRDARDAGRPDGRRRDGGGPAPTTRASALGSHPGAAAGDVAGGPRDRGATTPRGRTGGGGPCGRDRMMWAGGHHAGTVGSGESATGEARPAAARRELHGVAGMLPMGPAAAATGPSRQCRPLKLTLLPGYLF